MSLSQIKLLLYLKRKKKRKSYILKRKDHSQSKIQLQTFINYQVLQLRFLNPIHSLKLITRLGVAANTNRIKIQVLQNKYFRIVTNTPWYVRSFVIHFYLRFEMVDEHIATLSFHRSNRTLKSTYSIPNSIC